MDDVTYFSFSVYYGLQPLLRLDKYENHVIFNYITETFVQL